MRFVQKPLRQEEIQALLSTFQSALAQLLSSKSSTISYQLTYDAVYRLCKQNKQKAILSQIVDRVNEEWTRRVNIIEKAQTNVITAVISMEKENKEIIQRIAEVCLFFDVNYCQKQTNLPIRNHLKQLEFASLTNSNIILEKIASQIFKFQLNGSQSDAKESLRTFIKNIHQIDQKDEFFDKFLVPKYIPLLQKYYIQESKTQFNTLTLPKYLEWALIQIQSQRNSLQQLFHDLNPNSFNPIIVVVYDQCVQKYLQLFYLGDKDELFKNLTLQLLELLKYGKKGQVEKHVIWYMGQIQAKLSAIDLKDNNKFIQQFCTFYQEVMAMLKSTQNKFDINYRSIFAFEQWINVQRINIPFRLAHYINQSLSSKNALPPQFLKHCALIFRLMKEKNVFQNNYRKLLIKRRVEGYQQPKRDEQAKLVQLMGKQCGQEWIKKIVGLQLWYDANVSKYTSKNQLISLQPLIIDESDYPYEDRLAKVSLHPKLLQLTAKFTQQYSHLHKERKLQWNAQVGRVLLVIKYKEGHREVEVTTAMANVLLFVKKGGSKIAQILCQTGYKLDQVQKSIQKMAESKLILCEPAGNDHIISIPQSATFESAFLSLIRQNQNHKFEVKAMEELKADRKLMVEAIIVKLMKGDKLSTRAKILEKTAPLLATKGFSFNEEFVKGSIERLLQKEFIRQLQDGSISYIA